MAVDSELASTQQELARCKKQIQSYSDEISGLLQDKKETELSVVKLQGDLGKFGRSEQLHAAVHGLELWRAEGRGEVAGVLHCYTGSLDFARRALDARLEISFSGIVTFKKADDLRAGAQDLLEQALNTAQDAQAAVVETGRQIVTSTDDYVQSNPWRAIAIGTGIGLLVGLAVGRSADRY